MSKELIKILTIWSIENKEYEMLYFLYNEFNFGIPIKYIYKLPDQIFFSSVNSFFNNRDNKKVDDIFLNKLFGLFKKSKYKRLENFENLFGYCK